MHPGLNQSIRVYPPLRNRRTGYVFFIKTIFQTVFRFLILSIASSLWSLNNKSNK